RSVPRLPRPDRRVAAHAKEWHSGWRPWRRRAGHHGLMRPTCTDRYPRARGASVSDRRPEPTTMDPTSPRRAPHRAPCGYRLARESSRLPAASLAAPEILRRIEHATRPCRSRPVAPIRGRNRSTGRPLTRPDCYFSTALAEGFLAGLHHCDLLRGSDRYRWTCTRRRGESHLETRRECWTGAGTAAARRRGGACASTGPPPND